MYGPMTHLERRSATHDGAEWDALTARLFDRMAAMTETLGFARKGTRNDVGLVWAPGRAIHPRPVRA